MFYSCLGLLARHVGYEGRPCEYHETILAAVEIKTEHLLRPDLCFTLLRISPEDKASLAEQLKEQPGFVNRFLWPTQRR